MALFAVVNATLLRMDKIAIARKACTFRRIQPSLLNYYKGSIKLNKTRERKDKIMIFYLSAPP